MKLDHWRVSRRNVDTICLTVQVPYFVVTQILTQVRHVAKFHVTPMFVLLHVNSVFPYETRKDPRLRKSSDSDELWWRTVEYFWSNRNILRAVECIV